MSARILTIVLFAFTAAGGPAVRLHAEPLLAVQQKAFADRDPNERVKAVRVAGEALSPDALRLLLVSLGDPHPRVRREAVKALSGAADPVAIEAIGRAATKGATEDVRAGAAETLGRIKSSSSSEPLKAALKDPSPKVRACALSALQSMADPSTAGLVVERLKDSAPLVRAAAAEALAAVDPAQAARLLPPCLADRDYEVRIAAVESLPRIAPEEAASTLKRALADPAWQVRVAGVETAERLRKAELIPLLIERLSAEKGRLRGDLLRTLHRLTGREIGLDPAGWTIWWESHGKDFQCPEAAKDGTPAHALMTTVVGTFCSIPLYSRRVAFVLDLSGSMRDTTDGKEEGPRKVEVVKAELYKAIRAFTPETSFNIILLGSDAEGRFDAKKRCWMPRLAPATPEARERACAFSAAQAARGYTNIYDAVMLAFQDPDVDTVILLSDGGATRGAFVARQEILDEVLEANRFRKIAVHTVQSGAKREGDKFLLAELASRTGGITVKK
jgi:HEAT repeat protein